MSDYHITYEKDGFMPLRFESIVDGMPPFELTEDEIQQLMEGTYPQMSDEEFFNHFDAKLKLALDYLSLFLENWEKETVSEMAFESYSCTVKLARVLQLVAEYNRRKSYLIIYGRKENSLSLIDKIKEYFEAMRQVVFRIGALSKNTNSSLSEKKSDTMKMNMFIIPRLIEKSHIINATNIKTSNITSDPKLKNQLRNKIMSYQIDAGFDEPDPSYYIDMLIPEAQECNIEDDCRTLLNMMNDFQNISGCYVLRSVESQNILMWFLGLLLSSIDGLLVHEKWKSQAFDETIEKVKVSDKFKSTLKEETNKILFDTGLQSLTIDDCKRKIAEIKKKMQSGIGNLYIRFRDEIPQFVDELRNGKYSREEIDELFLEISLLDHFQKKLDEYIQYNKEHPIAEYIRRGDKVEVIIDWLHRAIKGKTSPKEQIAPIKAAMNCKPQAVNETLPFDVFIQEFKLSMSKDTWENWTRGYHSCVYTENDLKDYIAELQAIMNQNCNL